MSPTTATYVYCVVQSPGAPDVTGVPDGLPGASPPRALPLARNLWLIAADAPLPEYGGTSIDAHLPDLDWVGDRALAHERVVEHFAASWPVLPLKLFTLFASDGRAVERLRERQEDIGRVLARLAGRVEWGVRILFREKKAKKQETPPEDAPATGKSFLLRKKAEQEGARAAASEARAAVETAYEDLARQAVAVRRHTPEAGEHGARLLLDAAFLVAKGDGGGFEEAVQGWADRLAEHGCDLTLTGPWPPYNFIEEPPHE